MYYLRVVSDILEKTVEAGDLCVIGADEFKC